MPRFKMLIEFKGTNYCGWQKQPNNVTVEEEIESALSQILQTPIDIIGQGRTDSGVHAEGQVAHFDYPGQLDADRLLFGLLGVLPHDIAVWDLEEVDADFHARFDALSRRYRYQIALRPMPLLRSTSLMVLEDLNLDAMRRCAEVITGTHNFDSFTKPDNENPDSTCEILQSGFRLDGSLLTYVIEANRFVRHMVRRLVGTMLQVGKGKKTVAYFTDLIASPSKDKNAHGSAAKGLILEAVDYGNDQKSS
ncbi:tRNA pseudouridine38-40 synthase [Fodinibius salinus]|uniref:tRNA pseudouridine synthase A n=1 Tax=Fodinibius salinus TaxID=860790 RepID=A0A5D3YLN2_9BACT|nr:tRNA pseudouridine(38-40) synthase TruA [Fodinibius salinus]TYP94854.1 tRNA pseudouridine38-40 synthase [Fodinibius salinus]